ncbi:MAG TPA: hypothetical protein VFL66_00725 [Gaiellaceae bacterium]|nr:hypothetical protein [Gaiellaceae bacterium]
MQSLSWLVVVSTFLAAGVEWIEAFTIVLAVGVTKGWRSALAGAAGAAALLLAAVAVFGATLGSFPLGAARAVVGVFLLLFGLRWLHKAMLRAAGLKALHDEEATFAETRAQLGPADARGRLDWAGTATAFNGVLLEGLEVVFIVIALGGLHSVGAASVGAVAALGVVALAGVALRAPLTRVPENALKYVVGLALTSFGTFFAGEGVGVSWWHGDASILLLVAAYAAVSFLLVVLLKAPPLAEPRPGGLLRVPRAVALELWGLFVGEGALAAVAVAVVLAVGLFVDRLGHHALAGLLLALGVVFAVVVAVSESRRVSVQRGAGDRPT